MTAGVEAEQATTADWGGICLGLFPAWRLQVEAAWRLQGGLWFVSLLLLLLSLSFILAVSDLLLLALLHIQLNWESNELRVLLDQVLQASLFKELGLVLLQVANDLGATLDLSMDQLCILSGSIPESTDLM